MNNKSNKNDDILLQVNNLKTYFYSEGGTVKAADDVSFYVKRG